MVLKPGGWIALSVALSVGQLAFAGKALAQQIDRTTPALDLPLPGMDPIGVEVGPLVLLPSGEARLEYDSNIYAAPANRVDDQILVITPRLGARLRDAGKLSLSLLTEARLRRYFDRSSENSTAGLVQADTRYEVTQSDILRLQVGWRRQIEDRGDPEARDILVTGPRALNLFQTEAGWTHEGARFQLGVVGNYDRINYRSTLDDERDLEVYGGRITAEYSVRPAVSAVVTGFVTRRDFRLPVDSTGVNRDATTYGVRAGLRLNDTGFLRGSVTAGVYHFSPEDAGLSSRTGLSVEAALTYLPWRRVAFTLSAFRGDVATVRVGAQSRTDTRAELGVQAEARHNLRLSARTFYRKTKFTGAAVSERTVGVAGEVEYRLNRLLSVAAVANYADRDSDDPSQNFKRLRAGIELRAQF